MSFRDPADGIGRHNHGRPRQKFPSRDLRKRPMTQQSEINRTWTGASGRVANRAYPREFDLGMTMPGHPVKAKPSGIRMLDGRIETVPPPLPDGSVGGRFSSTINFRAVNHPAMRGTRSRRSTRLQPIYSQRWVAVPPDPEELLHFNPNTSVVPLTFVNKSKSFETAWSDQSNLYTPQVSQSSYLMIGQRITPRSKRNMEQEELQQFQKLGLKPAPELFFGRGFGTEPKTVRVRSLSQQLTATQVDTLKITHDSVEEEIVEEDERINEEAPTHNDNEDAVPQDDYIDAHPELDYVDDEEEERDHPNELSSGLAGWEGTVMESSMNAGDEGKKVLSLLRGVDDQPASLDVHTYQLREFYGAATDNAIQRLSEAFMHVDEAGVGKITVDALKFDVEKKFSPSTWELVAEILNLSPGNSVALREYIAALYVAELISSNRYSIGFASVDLSQWTNLCESFFNMDKEKCGRITLIELRSLLPGMSDEQWLVFNQTVALDDAPKISLFETLLAYPGLL
eukprot:m.130871 g.130871  ORF g.130871 m.130871 type:complete len:512 (-) comp29507_c0_seq1:92-1627(-)